MTEIEQLEKAISIAKRCGECEYCKSVNAGNDWWFKGCFCDPYRGKWISEIDNCPKTGVDNPVDKRS